MESHTKTCRLLAVINPGMGFHGFDEPGPDHNKEAIPAAEKGYKVMGDIAHHATVRE